MLLNGHTCNLMWSDAQFQKPHCCCYIQNNHHTSIWHMKLDLKSCILNTKRKSKSWSQFLPSFQQKFVALAWHNLILATSDSFSFLDLVCCEVFFFQYFCVNEVYCTINSTLPQSKIVFNTNLLVRQWVQNWAK